MHAPDSGSITPEHELALDYSTHHAGEAHHRCPPVKPRMPKCREEQRNEEYERECLTDERGEDKDRWTTQVWPNGGAPGPSSTSQPSAASCTRRLHWVGPEQHDALTVDPRTPSADAGERLWRRTFFLTFSLRDEASGDGMISVSRLSGPRLNSAIRRLRRGSIIYIPRRDCVLAI